VEHLGQRTFPANARRVPIVHARPDPHDEATAAIILATVALRLERRGAPDGAPALFFAAGFLAFRAFNQTLRAPSLDQLLPEPVLVEAYALGALACGVMLLGRVASRRQESPLGAGLP